MYHPIRYTQTLLTHKTRRLRPSRSFIVPEVLGYFAPFRETQLILLLELLMAEGVITRYGVGARIGGGPEVNDRKRAREDYSSGPSTKRRTGPTVKKEEMSVNARAQRIQALQVSRVN